MNQKIENRLAHLNADYESVFGSPFRHFFCPILYRDEDTELCQAHVINKSFRDSDRSWTIQRKDVDSFYGSLFEADFLAIQEKDRQQVDEVMADKDLARQLKPKFLLDGEVVEHYYPKGDVPPAHSQITLFTSEKNIQLALKRSQEAMLNAKNENWEIRVDKNLNLPALVSLLKAAHLTLFHLLGYRHVQSSIGYFLGKIVLGDFFLQAREMKREEALDLARTHFTQFANMVRPILTKPCPFKGTLTDHWLYILMNGDQSPWALMIFIRTENHVNAVLVPTMVDEEATIRFFDFLKKPCSTINVRRARWEGDRWEIAPESGSETHVWPEAQFDAGLNT